MSTQVLTKRFGGPGASGTFFGAEVRTDLSGLGKLQRLLSGENAAIILRRNLEPMAEAARENEPILTGLLESTVRVDVPGTVGWLIRGRVVAGSTEAYYAPHVEFNAGNRIRFKGRRGPHALGRAYEEEGPLLTERVATDIARTLGGGL
jgi:hypothetical protein